MPLIALPPPYFINEIKVNGHKLKTYHLKHFDEYDDDTLSAIISALPPYINFHLLAHTPFFAVFQKNKIASCGNSSASCAGIRRPKRFARTANRTSFSKFLKRPPVCPLRLRWHNLPCLAGSRPRPEFLRPASPHTGVRVLLYRVMLYWKCSGLLALVL